ncbi:MAG: glucose-6-phosphate dehydrogenase [Cryobacterium sp.]|nr:glucose-6-phosphate dehydrogenase [Cryobacterium sp.]MBX3104224.1 glucose-6-phosphate dehydrogenase [Cryobacterium sp.]
MGTLIIFGASGDLTQRLLLPGLGQLLDSKRGADFKLIGVGQDKLSDSVWRSRVSSSFKAGGAKGARSQKLARETTYVQADVTNQDDLRKVLALSTGTPAIYFALPPRVTIASCEALSKISLPSGTVFGLEKPFGTDLRSAAALNRRLVKILPESQLHRVDHFLGKSTVLNVLGVRFANRILEPIWNSENIARVDIVFDETLGLEGRAGYYDRAGALVDMIQSHLLLVMALVAMEPPSSLDADDLRGSMAQVLRATRVFKGEPEHFSRRGRYTSGTIAGKKLPDYLKEQGVDPKNRTETLAEVAFGIENWRWSGVPFVLRSGKALGLARKEIIVTFKDVPHLPKGFSGATGPATLRIGLSPDVISLDLNINGEGNPFTIDRVVLETQFASGDLAPYGEVLFGLLNNDPTLSVRADEIEECWRIVAPVLTAWKHNKVDLENYRAGSNGPARWAKRALGASQ